MLKEGECSGIYSGLQSKAREIRSNDVVSTYQTELGRSRRYVETDCKAVRTSIVSNVTEVDHWGQPRPSSTTSQLHNCCIAPAHTYLHT